MHGEARQCIRLLLRGKDTLQIVPQNIYEFWVVATRPIASNGLGLTVGAVKRKLERSQSFFELLLDTTARVGLLDLVVPFHSSYGTLAIGVGALSVDLLVIVTVTAYLKRRMSKELWLWVHRLAYLAFALAFLHAVLSGTDFSDPVVSAITWGTAAALLTLTVARLLGGRLPA